MTYSQRFTEALQFAADLHRNQSRKGSGLPYIGHLLAVASLVIDQGADEDTAIAALLHDSVEDQGGREVLGTIAARFGPRVAALVEACSDAFSQPKPPWRQRKEAFLARLTGATREARLIVAADKLHNARCILADYAREGEALWERFKGGREGTLWNCRAALDVLRCDPSLPLLDELEEAVGRLEAAAGTPV